MTRSFLTLFFCTFMLASLSAQQPALIDREIFFGNPEISGAQLSPDGQYMSFRKAYKGTMNIWVKKALEPFESARPITADTVRPISSYFWSRDGKYVLFAQDKGGNENYHIYAVDPAAAPAPGQDVPQARDLTPVEKVRAAIYGIPRGNPQIMYVGLNERDPAWHDLYQLNIATGELQLLRENTERITGWVFDLKDQLKLATRSAPDGSTEILRVDSAGFTVVYSCTGLETCAPLRYHKDGKRFYMVTDKGRDRNLSQLIIFDPIALKEYLVESDPLDRVDFGNAVFSDVTDELIATVYTDVRQRIYIKDDQFVKDFAFLKKQFPSQEVNFGSHTRDENLWLVSVSSDTDPGAAYLFDRKKRTVTFQYRPYPKIPVDQMAEMKGIKYPSSDGMEIPAYLVLPKGVDPVNLPLVVFPHGGPWARDYWGYNPYAQFLANRGYAVLMSNFRGSTGYGKAFLNAGNGQWGKKMQDDLTWGVKYLVSQGTVDSNRIGIMGGSYGGYATLAGLAFTPDVYAAGVSIVGPSNLMTLLNSIPPYWEAIRKVFYMRMGDPSSPEGEAFLKEISPLFSANNIKAPLLVVQGANDPRVNKAESDQIVVAMRELGRPVEYLVAPDEGHGFARPVNNMAMLAAAEKFLAKHLGGRYQESMTPEVAKRLQEITVDIQTVNLPKKEDPGKAAWAPAPQPATDLKAGTFLYQTQLEIGGQKIALDQKLEIKEEGGNWVLTESTSSPMTGMATDASTVTRGSLLPVQRNAKQGPVTVHLDYAEKKVTGEISVNAQKIPVDKDLEASLFADGGGANAILATLPFAEGYKAAFRNLDLQSLQIKVFELTVLGSESVQVPAGTFDCFKIQTAPTDNSGQKTIFWVAKDGTDRVVKTQSVMPQMNGAVVTSELKQ